VSAGGKRPRGLVDLLRHGDLAVLLLPVVLLAAGWIVRAKLTGRTVAYAWRGISLSHPAGWAVAERSPEPGGGESVVLMDLLGPGRIKPRVTLRLTRVPAPTEPAPAPEQAPAPTEPAPAPEQAPAPSAAAATTGSRLPLYYAISEQPVVIGQLPATRIDSAFAFTPPAGTPARRDIPVVMRAIDLVVLRGRDALSVQLAAPIDDFEAQRPMLESIAASTRIDAPVDPPAEAPAAATAPEAAEPAVAVDEAPAGGDLARAVSVSGRVSDAESGLPVPGAIVVVLGPGKHVDDVSGENLGEVAFTTGLVGSDGVFATNRRLPRGARYGVMVVAEGYRWIGTDDGVTVDDATPEALDVGMVHLRHR
jgi:hypothetical protein